MQKQARNLGLSDVPTGAGPDQMLHALAELERLRALARPTDDQLKQHNLSRPSFESTLRKIINKSQGKPKFNFSDIAPDPKMRALGGGALGLLGGALAGVATGNAVGGFRTALAGAGTGSLAGYLTGLSGRRNMLNTAKMLKQYGLLTPQLASRSYPLLASEPKYASAMYKEAYGIGDYDVEIDRADPLYYGLELKTPEAHQEYIRKLEAAAKKLQMQLTFSNKRYHHDEDNNPHHWTPDQAVEQIKQIAAAQATNPDFDWTDAAGDDAYPWSYQLHKQIPMSGDPAKQPTMFDGLKAHPFAEVWNPPPPAAMLPVKQAALSTLLNMTKQAELPPNAAEALIGAGGGAGLGALWHLLRRKHDNPREGTKLFDRLFGGAMLGGAAGGLYGMVHNGPPSTNKDLGRIHREVPNAEQNAVELHDHRSKNIDLAMRDAADNPKAKAEVERITDLAPKAPTRVMTDREVLENPGAGGVTMFSRQPGERSFHTKDVAIHPQFDPTSPVGKLILRHEGEHFRQDPLTAYDFRVAELGPSLGDYFLGNAAHRKIYGNSLNPDLGWMTDQALEHQWPKKTMDSLLGTDTGIKWLQNHPRLGEGLGVNAPVPDKPSSELLKNVGNMAGGGIFPWSKPDNPDAQKALDFLKQLK